MRRTKPHRFSMITLFLAASTLILLSTCKEEAPSAKPAVPVRVHKVREYEGDAPLRYSASLRPKSQVELYFRVGGYVQDVLQVKGPDGSLRLLQEGDWVKKGLVLAHLRDSDYRAKVRQARGQIRELEATLRQAGAQLIEAMAQKELAQADFERASALLERRSLTKPEYDAAQAKLQAAKAGEEAARAQGDAANARIEGARALVVEAETALKDTSLLAPMDGLILKRAIEPGSLAGPSAPAFVIADTTVMKAAIGIPDVHLSKIRPSDTLTLAVQALPSKELQGVVSRIHPAADPASRIFEVELSLPNPDNLLKAGMIASVRLSTEAKPVRAPVVPLSAIVRDRNRPEGYAVLVVEEQAGRQIARSRSVELGEAFGNMLAVAKGLQAGENIILSGAQLITDGQIVRVIP